MVILMCVSVGLMITACIAMFSEPKRGPVEVIYDCSYYYDGYGKRYCVEAIETTNKKAA